MIGPGHGASGHSRRLFDGAEVLRRRRRARIGGKIFQLCRVGKVIR